uniref:F-box associated beta-propeller type 1 domain-containing protein n=1 Tax=Opuntia streptacantha TaxID=393608 RepID=A0A7C8ZGX1_OPUST
MKKGVFAKGFMHWIHYDSSLVPKRRNYTHLASFNFNSEKFTYSRLPGDRDDDGGEILAFPFILGDSFAILDMTSASTCIWVLRRCDNGWDSWTKCYTGGFRFRHFRVLPAT